MKASLKIITVTCLTVMMFVVNTVAQVAKYDVVIKNAMLVDGSGATPKKADVAIIKDRIALVGQLKGKYTAKEVVDGTNLYLSPGLIDPHTHYYSYLASKDAVSRALPRAVMQGVSTVFAGNDGSGPLPIKATQEKLEKLGIGTNIAFFVGHNTVRQKVLGEADVQPTAQQLQQMEDLVEQAMKDGAFGISTGLFYTPGNYAKTEEVIALSKVAAKYGGVYDTHQRDEGSQSIGVVASTKEVLNIGYKAKIPVHFSHIKIAGPPAWSKRDSVIYLIEKAQKEGVKVTANQYPYTASQTSLIAAVIPAWARDGGTKSLRERYLDPILKDSIVKGIDAMIAARSGDPFKLIVSAKANKEINGKSIGELAKIWNLSQAETVIKITSKEAPSVHSFTMREEDIEAFMKKPWVMLGSDGGGAHPRSHGSFAKFISEYALNKKVVSLNEAIYKSSYLAAKTLNIKDRGLIKEGFFADLFLFDAKKYKDLATYDNGEVFATGVKHMWINGQQVIKDEQLTNKLSGKALRLLTSK